MQRIPPTEKFNRRHSSTLTVAVLKVNEINGIKLERKDVDFSACRAGGHGGQNVNKRSTAVRLTHRETGETVVCREERLQGQNKARALRKLESRLNEDASKKHKQEEDFIRKNQVGCGMKGDKIRTYNYRENRVTNHKNGKSVNRLREIVEDGRIELIPR